MLPMGGAKGYGIALIVEILSSCLSGALNGQTMGSFYDFSRTQNSGYAFGAIDIGKIVDIKLFKENVDNLFDGMKACPKAEGITDIKIPGEIEFEKEAIAKKDGIEISEAVAHELESVAKHYEIDSRR